jgi:hypothetical protein
VSIHESIGNEIEENLIKSSRTNTKNDVFFSIIGIQNIEKIFETYEISVDGVSARVQVVQETKEFVKEYFLVNKRILNEHKLSKRIVDVEKF